jgi:transposase
MMEQKEATGLNSWIERALNVKITELNSFANGLLNDLEAIKNELTLP